MMDSTDLLEYLTNEQIEEIISHVGDQIKFHKAMVNFKQGQVI